MIEDNPTSCLDKSTISDRYLSGMFFRLIHKRKQWIDWGQVFLEFCQHQTPWIEDARSKTPNAELFLAGTESLVWCNSRWYTQKLLSLNSDSFEGKPWTQPKTMGPFFWPGSDACTGTNKIWSYHERTKSAGSIEMIPTVLRPFLLACGFGTTGLSLKRKIHAEHCYRPKIFLSVLGGSYGMDWTLCIAWCEPPHLKKIPWAFGVLCLTECGKGESRVPSLRSFGNILTELFQTGWLTH